MLLLLGLLLLIEGLGFPDRQTLLLGALLIPIYALGNLVFQKETIKFPKRILVLILVFISALTISQVFSPNYSQSIPLYLLTLGGICLSFYSYQQQVNLKKYLPWLLLGLGLIFAIYSVWLKWQIGLGKSLWLAPLKGENLVFSTYPNHNHLGDFLALVGAMLPLTLPFSLPLIIWSFSRTSYLSLLLTQLAKLKNAKHKLWLLLTVVILTGGLIYAFSLKSFFNGRDNLWQTVWQTFKLSPWFGIGLGNFMTASIRFTRIPYNWTETAENIFLNLLAETGILTTLIFFILVLYVLFKAKKDNTFFYGFLCLIFLFQTDYLFSFYSLWLLFWILLGLNIQPEKKEVVFGPQVFLLPLALLSTLILIINLYYFNLSQGQIDLAHLIYPWGPEARQKQIETAILSNNNSKLELFTRSYAQSFPLDVAKQQDAAAIYLRLGKKKEALRALEQAITWHPFEYGLYKQIYYLSKQLSGKKAARQTVIWYEKQLQHTQASWNKNKLLKDLEEFKRDDPFLL